MNTRRVLALVLVPLALAIAIGGYLIATVNTDTTITIGTGVPGSGSYETAVLLKEGLEQRGFDVDIETTPQTSNLINLLADPENPVDVTFLAEAVNPTDYPRVTSLGTIGVQPLLFGTLPGSHAIDTLPKAKGARIDIGPKGSVRAGFAAQVLEQFGVNATNSTFLHLPANSTRADLEKAGVQVVTARWSDPRKFLRELVAVDEIRVIPVPEAQALSGHIKSAEFVSIPVGTFQVNPPIPEEAIPAIGQLVTVVADEDVNPAAAYAIARQLTEMYSPGDALSAPGEYPNFSDRQLPINPYAADFYSTGAVPWQFDHLPPVIADSFVSFIVAGTTILILASIYSLFLPEAYSLWTGIIRPRSEERDIGRMESALAEGRELTLRQRRRLSEILQAQDAGRVLRQRVEALRPTLSAPIDDETDNERDPETGETLGERPDGR